MRKFTVSLKKKVDLFASLVSAASYRVYNFRGLTSTTGDLRAPKAMRLLTDVMLLFNEGRKSSADLFSLNIHQHFTV